jgi:hypothetical protein
MGAMIVRHSVRDYGPWRAAFDAHEPARTAAGLTNGRVYRSAEDPNELVLLFDAADRRRAEKFGASSELKETMQRAGVVGEVELHYVE